jgi:hypothetical protein
LRTLRRGPTSTRRAWSASAGGFATVALTTDPPPGLVAGISFAGGRGSGADDQVCREDRLVEAFRTLGRQSRIPMLWIYSDNDRFFGPTLAQRLHDAFTAAGGSVEFIRAPVFGSDGHRLFPDGGAARWTPAVDAFLARNHLAPRDTLLPPPPLPAIVPPGSLAEAGRKALPNTSRARRTRPSRCRRAVPMAGRRPNARSKVPRRTPSSAASVMPATARS